MTLSEAREIIQEEVKQLEEQGLPKDIGLLAAHTIALDAIDYIIRQNNININSNGNERDIQ